MGYPTLSSASIEAAVRGVFCHGGYALASHSRRVCCHPHLPANAEKCSRTTCNHEIISRYTRRSSWWRRASTESVCHNGPDRGAVSLQDFESEHSHRSPHGVSDCLAGDGGRA